MLSYGGAVGPDEAPVEAGSSSVVVRFICLCNKCSRSHLRHTADAVKGNVVITLTADRNWSVFTQYSLVQLTVFGRCTRIRRAVIFWWCLVGGLEACCESRAQSISPSASWSLAGVYGRIVLHGLWSEGDDGLWRRSRGRMIARRLAAGMRQRTPLTSPHL